MSSEPVGPLDPPPATAIGARKPALKLVAPQDPADSSTDEIEGWMLAIARHQDRQAFGRLFEHFGPRLKSWLMRTGSSPEFADDLVQDAFVMLWRKAAQFDPSRARVAAWLFTIARNLRVDRKRGVSGSWLSLDVSEVEQTADPTPDVETRLARARSEETVREALTQLTSDQRTLVQLSFYDDKPHSSIAAETGLPLGTVKTRLRAAAARLRSLLEEERP